MESRDKVAAIFTELVGARASRLSASHYLADVNSRITKALTKDVISDPEILKKDEAGFHIVDWQADAAFIVALSLYPEKFTDEEIEWLTFDVRQKP